MRPKKIWANLAVKDVKRTMEFYTTLGFKLNGGHNNGKELASFLVGDNDFVVHFFRNDLLKKAIEGELADLSKGNEIIFTLWSDSKAEVNAWAEEVRLAGGTLFSRPAEFGEGYYGFVFADPDGHKWNVFHMQNEL
ncbi:glyoxalase [Pedobacter sp. HMF7056]|uniref:Glyoxalase n=2 Tax=Hufsiella ginkgonis TaxID=2695274 RepID=A0A7K1XZP1_9SPHI|nr:glyoxalase [Hufsiella ginkgonis]